METYREKSLVSVIVPTYNSQKTIEKCLQSISDQTYQRIQTVVVDRHSNDQTVQIAERFGAKTLFVTEERSTAKNYAAKEAYGDYLFFVDSDMTLDPKTIEECVNKCEEAGVDAVTVPLRSISQGKLGECRKIERESLSHLSEFMDAPRFIKKTAFMKVGGFDEKLVCGEDFDLTQRLKKADCKIEKANAEISHFEGNPSLYDVLHKAYYYGRTLPALMKKGPKETAVRYANIRFESVKITGAMFRNIGFLFSFLVVKAFEYMAYTTGVFAQLTSNFAIESKIELLKDKLIANKSAIFSFAILISISLVIFRNFLFSAEWPGGGDVMGFISRAYLYGKEFRWLYVWRAYSFGFVEGINSMDFFLMILYSIFRDPSWTVKIFMFLSYLVAAASMYLFAYRYTRRHVAALSGSLVYVLNQWLFSQFTEAHVDIIFSYALAPLIFILLDKALKTGKLKDILLLSLGLGLLITGFHMECIVIYGVFLIFFTLFFLLYPSKNERLRARFSRLLKVSLPSMAIAFLLSAFFFVPFLTNVRAPYLHSSYTYPIEDAYGPSYSSVQDAFVLRAVEKWGYASVVDVYTELGLPDFPVTFFLSLIFVLAYCTLLIRRDRYTIFFAFSTAISVFLAKGPYPPYGQFFIWAWTNVPHFAVFRAANRWIMMATFSHAFFTALLVYYLVKHIEDRTITNTTDKYFQIKVKDNNFSRNNKMIVSVDFLNVLLKKLHKLIYTLSIMLLIFIFLNGFLSCFFFFSKGLQTYTPSVQDLAPYEWLASQPNDQKVITVCRSPSEWSDPVNGESDFEFGGMLTSLGWTHDIGFDGSFIHDKPILQNGGWDSRSRQFVDYLRFRLVRGQLSDRLLKVLGPFAYNYVVVPSYMTDKTRSFFLNQKGGRVLYNQSDLILQNEYAAQRLFAANQTMSIVGGFDSMDALCKIKSFDPSKTILSYVPESTEDVTLLYNMINDSQLFCFADSNILDLAMTSLSKDSVVLFAGDYGFSSLNLTKYWAKWPSWRTIGAFVLGGEILTTVGKNKIDLPFEINSDGHYSIFLRVGFAPTRGRLNLSVDGEAVGELYPYFPLMSKLQWVNMTNLNLAKGKHSITLENDGTGYNDVDAIAVVKPSDLESKMSGIRTCLQNFPGRLLYLLEAENTFLDSSNNDWYWTVNPYNGYVVRSESLGLDIASLAKVNATSETEAMEAYRAVDGDLRTRWTSEKGVLPQWLELTWDSTQSLRGVRIAFENAYAINYTIQTWNGTQWDNQVTVTGNTEFTRIHEFPQIVETNKLRIYVTGFSSFYRVSIWEFEAYSIEIASATSKQLIIPRAGNYMLAVRAATGPNYGTLYFKVNSNVYSISCNSSSNGFEWREIGPFHVAAGEAAISAGSMGLIELDELLLYSLKDNESYLSLDNLFNSARPNASVTCEKVNPCTYKAYINASEPFTLIFSETYDPLWKAATNKEIFSSTPAFSLVNSFRINKTGQFTLTVYYTGQSYTDIGLLIFLISFTSLMVILPLFFLQNSGKLDFFKQKLSRVRPSV